MLRAALLIIAVTARPVVADAVELKPLGVDQFFVTPKEESVLRWRIKSGRVGEPIEYTIRDYWGRPVASGSAKVVSGDVLEATVSLRQGFYDIELPALKQRFGVVSLPVHNGDPDPFFCIDSAMSWLVQDDQIREGLIRILHRSGVAMSRERLNWAQVNPADGQWSWEGPPRYETLRHQYAEQRVDLLEMFHSTTPWAGRVGKYPQDLVGTARAWRQIAERWSPTWGAFDVWNEPDISFGDFLPADQYVPLVKTLAYAFAQGQIDTPLVGGVFATYNRRFLDNAAGNGLLDCVQAVSFHTYGRAPAVETLIGNYRDWLRAHGKQTMPLWITECGRPWARGPDRPPLDQDANSALDITMKAVESRACGVARYFAFVYPFYEERDHNFGMMGRHATPLRSMAAYCRLASLLDGKRYLGDLACEDATIQRARVFGNQQSTVAVLYTGRPDAEATLKLRLPVLRVEGIDGRSLQGADDAVVPVPDGLAYVWLDRDQLGRRLRTDTPAMGLWTVALREAPSRTAPSPIVLRYQLDPALLDAGSDGYRLKAEAPGELSLGVRAFNLSDQAHRLALKLSFSQAAARVIGPETIEVDVPGEGFADSVWRVDLSRVFAAGRLRVTVTATGSTAERIAPLVLDLIATRGDGAAAVDHHRISRGRRVVLARWSPGR